MISIAHSPIEKYFSKLTKYTNGRNHWVVVTMRSLVGFSLGVKDDSVVVHEGLHFIQAKR